MKKKYNVTIEKDEDGMFVGEIEGLPGCYTQAKTMPELLARLWEVSEGSIQILSEINNNKNPKNRIHLAMSLTNA